MTTKCQSFVIKENYEVFFFLRRLIELTCGVETGYLDGRTTQRDHQVLVWKQLLTYIFRYGDTYKNSSNQQRELTHERRRKQPKTNERNEQNERNKPVEGSISSQSGMEIPSSPSQRWAILRQTLLQGGRGTGTIEGHGTLLLEPVCSEMYPHGRRAPAQLNAAAASRHSVGNNFKPSDRCRESSRASWLVSREVCK